MKENQKKAINLLETALEKAKSESADIPAIMGELFEETALETKSVLEEFNEKLEQNESYTKKYSLVEIEKDRAENEKLKKEKKKDEEFEY